ncbi:MAG: GH51 [uncultured Thermomicrobiales bacterium]|uniref:non-reducing end alpha-L-arabinofuranosidase n=1 Tax=uncultured Thermomicrobiales bacterium TaxID=1645740 RepID=A0A6J4U9C0_9BACT|nr:MAG: GH51 [uncultured Thermomicrobiales bacterium]
MGDTTLTVRGDRPIGTISPRLYGHFAEHLGRCCYRGLWLGHGQGADGFRPDVVEALRALPTPLLRWPGGCYADHYHWRDGIGPPAERPVRLGMSCGLQVEDDNGLGTHEFLRLCELIGAEPYLAGNVGSGTPQELCDWVEYCNATATTTLVRERAANGLSAPAGVRLWGVGNENWGCGGNYDAGSYAREFRRYATMLRHVDPAAELVACGYDDAWNQELLVTLGSHIGLVDHISIHSYWVRGGPETDFTDQDYYDLLAEVRETEAFVARTAAIVREASAGKHRIGIALDEWGVWHPEVRSWGPGDVERRAPVTYEQANTLRDGIAVALALGGFHRQCDVLSMANLAQVVNVLQAPIMTSGDRMWLTPTYHALRLHAPHLGATALPVDIEGSASLPDGTPAVAATASRGAQGLAVSIVNQHLESGASVCIAGAGPAGVAHGQMLTADAPNLGNSLEEPHRVEPAPIAVHRESAESWRVELPPHAMATVVIDAG